MKRVQMVTFLTLITIFTLQPLVYASSTPFAYWSFDDCTAKDASNNGYDGVFHGHVQCVDGVSGKAIHLASVSDYMEVSKDFSVQDFTLSFWVKLDGKAGDYNMFVQGGNHKDDYSNEWNFGLRDSDNSLEFCWQEECYWSSAGANLFDGQFHHIVYKKEGTTAKVYLDGQLFYTYNVTLTGTAEVENLVIGQDQDCLGGCFESDQILKGTIDEIRLYNKALSDTEIQALYSGTGTCSEAALEAARQEGFNQGVAYCKANPSACGINTTGSGSASQEMCASFDLFTNTLHIPCLSLGSGGSYWVDLYLINNSPVTLGVSNFGAN